MKAVPGGQSCWDCVGLFPNPTFFSRFRMKELDIKREDKVVCFGQLLGMCDHVSFPLGEFGQSAISLGQPPLNPAGSAGVLSPEQSCTPLGGIQVD